MTTDRTPKSTVLADDDRTELERSLGRLDRLARLMDDQFEVPIVGYRIGLDPIIGLVPGGGDWATWVVGVYIFWEALRLNVPRRTLGRIAANLSIDLVVGYVPALGDVFDAAFKANRKNVDLVLDFYDAHPGEHSTHLPDPLPDRAAQQHSMAASPGRYVAGLLVVLLLLAVAAAPIAAIWWLVDAT